MLLLSRRIDFFIRFATFCGITFIGDADGELEALDIDPEDAIVPFVDGVDNVEDAEDEWEWWMNDDDIERTERSEIVLSRVLDSGLSLFGVTGGEGVANEWLDSDSDELSESDGIGTGTGTAFGAKGVDDAVGMFGLFLEEGRDSVNGLGLRSLLGVLAVWGV